MKIAVAVVAALLVHLTLSILVEPYREILVVIGRRISYGNDIADLPKLFMIGFVVLGTVVGVVAGATARWLRRTS